MSNKLILWSFIIVPWLTLFLMKKEEIRRYFPVGIFAALTSIVIVDIGSTLHLWTLKDNIYPLGKVFPYHLGAIPVVTMWLFKFTFPNFLMYLSVDALYNLLFAFVITPWMAARGIRENINSTNSLLFVIVTLHGILLFGYQILQEGIPLRLSNLGLQTAAAKLRFKDKAKNN
ncbi:MAG: hypothetical protein ABFD08_04425 [Syntrophomonas sp.]